MDICKDIKHLKQSPFTTLLVKDGSIIFKEEHIEKLCQDAKKHLGISYFVKNLDSFLKEQRLQHSYYRLNIYLGNPCTFKLTPYLQERFRAKRLKVHPSPYYEKLPRLKLDPSRRRAFLEETKNAGFDDSIFCDDKGTFLESCFSNLFWMYDKMLWTPHPSLPIYKGVTLQYVLKAARALGYETRYAQEKDGNKIAQCFVFTCNSLEGICPVQQINSSLCLVNPRLNERLIEAYLKLEDEQSSRVPSLLDSHER